MESNLTKAFRNLRRKGYWAKQNHACCQTCGWAEVPDGKEEKVVFYHNQDNDDKIKGKPFHIAWSGNGKEIQSILEKNGVTTEWDGNNDKRIKILNW